jgi:predicted short-subunit dehydrogenase-like oxidoreductase (DUF2520 family)
MTSDHTRLERPLRVGIVGPGRVGTALANALREAGVAVEGPVGRGERPARCDAIVLCVPDAEIAAAAETVTAAAPLVGHTSGATPLSALAHAGVPGFGLHPLQSFAHPGVRFEGAGAAVAGATLEAAAEAIAAGAGLGREDARELFMPLVRQTVENLAELGPERALTGPVARGDEATVEAQRAAVEETAPELLGLFDELVERTRALAAARRAPA